MRAALIAIVCVWIPVAAAAADEAVSLRGISKVNVVAEPIPPALTARLTTAALVADVQRRVAGRVAVNGQASDPTVHVTVNAVPIETGTGLNAGVAYSVYVSVEQQATLTRNAATAPVVTWRRGGLGVAVQGRAREAIRQQLNEYVDLLLKDLAPGSGQK